MSPDTQVILDRIAVSDTLSFARHEALLKRIDKLEEEQAATNLRMAELENLRQYRDGQQSVNRVLGAGAFKVSMVVLAAFAAGFTGGAVSDGIRPAALPPHEIYISQKHNEPDEE